MGVIAGDVDLFEDGESSAMTTARIDERREIQVESSNSYEYLARNKLERISRNILVT